MLKHSTTISCRLLLVEDEVGIRVPLADSLRVAGFDVATAEDGESALQAVPKGGFDLIILDVLLPDKDGVAVCQELRENGVETPVLMLTVKTGLEDRVRGFAAGADDYIGKPFEFVELLARIKAIVRRSRISERSDSGGEQVPEFGEIRIDLARAIVWRGNEELELSAMEYDLLRYFLQHPGEVLHRSRLLQDVWLDQPKADTRTIDVHVTSLRKKIEKNPAHPRKIRTIRGKGYRYLPE